MKIPVRLDLIKKPFKAIGEFRPTSDANHWRKEFELWVSRRSFIGYHHDDDFDFRSMLHGNQYWSVKYAPTDNACKWHQDCNGGAHWILVWSDYRPTQVTLQLDNGEPTGEIITLAPYKIYIVNNHKCWHRAQQVNDDPHERRFVVTRFFKN